jgi:prephenate dehydrogenase
MFHQITILGPGLLGASIALVMKERALCNRVHVWSRRAETRNRASQADWCDATFDDAVTACVDSDFIVICTPVETIPPLLKEITPHLRPGALVTDVGSTKSEICREAQKVATNFIGSHPMAGSERAGMENARADLFEAAACILTPLETADGGQIDCLRRLWDAIGMRVVISTPEKHDEIVAHVSHLPHLLASSLCSYLTTKDPTWKNLAGGGLRDTTRVAAGDPVLWQQILGQNRQEILHAIDGFQHELASLKSAISQKDTAAITTLLKAGKEFRDTL